MINIKPYIDKFQIKHNYGSGYHIAYLAPSTGGYTIVTNDHDDHHRVSSLLLIENNDTITVNGEIMIVNLKGEKVSDTDVSVTTLDNHEVYIDPNNRVLESYRKGSFTKQKVYLKFVESTRLTHDFRTFLSKQGVDLTLISSQTLILIGVLFNEFIGDKVNVVHQICMDPLTNEYDIAVIVK